MKKIITSILLLSILPIFSLPQSVSADTPNNLKDSLFYGTDEKGDYKYVYALATGYNMVPEGNTQEWSYSPTLTDTKPFNGTDYDFYERYLRAQNHAVASSIYSQQFPKLSVKELATIKKEDITFIPAFATATGENVSNRTLTETEIRKLMREAKQPNNVNKLAKGWENYKEEKIPIMKSQSTRQIKFDKVEYGKFRDITSVRYRLTSKLDVFKEFESIPRYKMEEDIFEKVIEPLSDAHLKDYDKNKETSLGPKYKKIYELSVKSLMDNLKKENSNTPEQPPTPINPWDPPTTLKPPIGKKLSPEQQVQEFIKWDKRVNKSTFLKLYKNISKYGDPQSFPEDDKQWTEYIRASTAYHTNDDEKFYKTYKAIIIKYLKDKKLLPENNTTLENYISKQGYRFFENPKKNYIFYAVRAKVYIRPDLEADIPKPVPTPPPSDKQEGYKCFTVTNSYKAKDTALVQSDTTNIFTKVVVDYDDESGRPEVLRPAKIIKRSLRDKKIKDEVYVICIPIEDTPKTVTFKSCINKTANGKNDKRPPNEVTFENNCKETKQKIKPETIDLMADVELGQMGPLRNRDNYLALRATGTGSSEIPDNWEGLKSRDDWFSNYGLWEYNSLNRKEKLTSPAFFTTDSLEVGYIESGACSLDNSNIFAVSKMSSENGFQNSYYQNHAAWFDPTPFVRSNPNETYYKLKKYVSRGNVYGKSIKMETNYSSSNNDLNLNDWRRNHPNAKYIHVYAKYRINFDKDTPTKERRWDNNVKMKCKKIPLPGNNPPPGTIPGVDEVKCKNFYKPGKSTDPKVPPQLAGVTHTFKVDWTKGTLKIPGNVEIIDYTTSTWKGREVRGGPPGNSRELLIGQKLWDEKATVSANFYPVEILNKWDKTSGKKKYKVDKSKDNITELQLITSNSWSDSRCGSWSYYTDSQGRRQSSCDYHYYWDKVDHLDTITVRYHLGAYQDSANTLENPIDGSDLIKSGYAYRPANNGAPVWKAGVIYGNTDKGYTGDVRLFDPLYTIKYPSKAENKITSFLGEVKPDSSRRAFKEADLIYVDPSDKDEAYHMTKETHSFNVFKLIDATFRANGPRDTKPASSGRVIYSSIDFGDNDNEQYLYVENWYESKVEVYDPWKKRHVPANGDWDTVYDCDRSRISIDKDTAWGDSYVHPSDEGRGLDSENNQDTKRKDSYTEDRFKYSKKN